MQCVRAMFASSSSSYKCSSHEDAICSVDLPKMSPSSSTSTGSQIATWRRSLTWTRREFSFDLQPLLSGKIFVWLPTFLSLNPDQRDIFPHRQSQLSDLIIRHHITTSLKSLSQKRWLYHQILKWSFWPVQLSQCKSINVTWPIILRPSKQASSFFNKNLTNADNDNSMDRL